MSESFSKDQVFEGLAEVGLALANKHRLQIVSLLSHGPKTVEQLVHAIEQSKATTSAHLKTLRTAGLVSPRKEGKYVWYSLSDPAAEKLWLALRTIGEHLLPGLRAKLDLWNQADALVSNLSTGDLDRLIEKRKCLLVDLRPESEFKIAHIHTAVNAPLADLDAMMPKLKSKLPILAYCRGPYCLNARAGITRIAQVFPTARRLQFSVPEWRAAGGRIDSADCPEGGAGGSER